MNKLDGWLVLDKPLHLSSAQAVGRVKYLLKPLKIGHAGTLDPLASGVLPLALGEATKTVQFMMETVKGYRFTVQWGEARDTDDAEGQVVGLSDVRPAPPAILAVLPQFTGRIMQAPPAYSAIHVDGKRAYALARAGETVVLPPREVRVDVLELVDYTADSASFSVLCGKGTYVRSLARDMALALGTLGYVTQLRRTRVGMFDENHAISLENLEKMVHKGPLAKVLQPVESVLDDIPAREIPSALVQRVRDGQALALPSPGLTDGSLVQVRSSGTLIAICSVLKGMMKPVRVFNL